MADVFEADGLLEEERALYQFLNAAHDTTTDKPLFPKVGKGIQVQASSNLFTLHFSAYCEAVFRHAPDVRRCEKCETIMDKWDIDLSLARLTKKPEHDATTSLDGVKIVSRTFVDVCLNFGLFGIEFQTLAIPGFYALRASRQIHFKQENTIQFENRCIRCGHYESVIGPNPEENLARPFAVAPKEFVQTSIEFASMNEKSPLLLCGQEAGWTLLRAGLSGIHTNAVLEQGNGE